MSVQYYSPMSLWLMSGDEFNEWRAANDLPLLRDFIAARLPHFREWMAAFNIDDRLFCRVVPTGALFAGAGKKLIVEEAASGFFRRGGITREHLEQQCKELGRPMPAFREFEPYFSWAKKKLGRRRYFDLDSSGNAKTDVFAFTRWMAHNAPEKSRAALLGDFEVLKLGGTTLGERMYLGGRNLDFTDLDHLVVTDKRHGPGTVEINFSSCRRMVFSGAQLHNAEFRYCDLDRFACEDSDLHNVLFRECAGKRMTFSGSRLAQVTFSKCVLQPDFISCRLEGFVFKPRPEEFASAVSDEYRRLRINAQESGNRLDAAMHYYMERKYERKALANPYVERPAMFPAKGYNGRLRDIIDTWWRGDVTGKKALRQLLGMLLFRLRVWTSPRMAPRALGFLIKYVASVFEEIVWGYGERPLRIFTTAFCLIGLYAGIYYFSAPELCKAFREGSRIVNAVYFSVVTFSTLGYGDILPETDHMKIVCATEALCGIFTMGLVVAGFSNKSRY